MEKRRKITTKKMFRKIKKSPLLTLHIPQTTFVITQDKRFADELNKNKIPCIWLEGLSQWTEESTHIHDEMEQIRWQGCTVYLIPSISDGKAGLANLIRFAKMEIMSRGARCVIPGAGVFVLQEMYEN